MHHFKGPLKKLITPCASAERLKREQNYLKNGSAVLAKILAVCDGNCRIPLRYFTAIEIQMATKHSEERFCFYARDMVKGLLDNTRPVLICFTCGPPYGSSKEACRDIAITAQMSHLKNVLRLIGCCLEYEDLVLVYEYIEAVTLHDLLFNKGSDNHDPARRKSLSWRSRLRIASQIASALVFLHSEFTTPVIYKDLDSKKVLIDQRSGVAKLFDFSESVPLPPGKLEVDTGRVSGTYGYADPKYVESGIVTQKADVFSFGVLLFQLLTGKKASIVESMMTPLDNPYAETNIKEYSVMDMLDPAILEEHGTQIQQQLEDCFELVKRCTAKEGEDRPYMIQVARDLLLIEKCLCALNLDQK